MTSGEDIERVLKDGRKARHPVLWLYSRKTEGEETRLGLIVGKAVGGAVVRTRTRRRLREAFRNNRPMIAGTYDIVLRARPGFDNTSTESLNRVFLDLCRQVGIRFKTRVWARPANGETNRSSG